MQVSGFTGSNALVLILASERAGAHRFLTDFRYETQSAEQVPERFAREIVSGELLDAAVAALLATAGAAGRLGFDDAQLTVAQHTRLRELLPAGWQLVPCAGAVERMRAVKDAHEIDRIRAATQLADEALRRSVLSVDFSGAPSARWRSISSSNAPARRRGTQLPLDRRLRRPRRATPRRAPRAADRARCARDDRLGRLP